MFRGYADSLAPSASFHDSPEVHAQPPEITYADASCQFMRWDDLFVSRWMGVAGVDHVRKMTEHHTRFLDAHEEQTTLVLSHVDMEEIRPVDEAVRAEIRVYDLAVVNRIRAGATVIVAGGFSGVVVRGILSGLALLTRRAQRSAVVSTPREGLDFLSRHRVEGRATPSLDVLVRAYEQACGKR